MKHTIADQMVKDMRKLDRERAKAESTAQWTFDDWFLLYAAGLNWAFIGFLVWMFFFS